jgi:hypothetical protein
VHHDVVGRDAAGLAPLGDRVVEPRLGIGQAGQQVSAAWLAGRDGVDEVLDKARLPGAASSW